MTVSVSQLPNGRQQFFGTAGVPLVGGTVYMYIPGTTTASNTWQDSGGTILNTNPIVLDGLASASIWGTGYYRQVVFDDLGNQIWDEVVEAPSVGRTQISAATTYYWNPNTGNDNNPGTIGAPFATFVALYSMLQQTVDLSAGYTLTAQCTATGTITDRILLQGPLIGQTSVSQFVIQGPGSASLTVNSAFSCIYADWNAAAYVTGFTLTNTGPYAQVQVLEGSATLNLGDIQHGAAAVGDMQSANGTIRRLAPFTTTGSKQYVGVSEVANGLIDLNSQQITFVGVPTYSVAAFNVGESSYIDLGATPSYVGTFNGPPWLVSPTGELGQNNAGRTALQACTTTLGVWSNGLFTSITIGDPAGASYPAYDLTLIGSAGEVVATPPSSSLAVLSNNGNSGLSIHSGLTSTGTIYFGRSVTLGNVKGALVYNHASDIMSITAGGVTTVAQIGATGVLNLLSGGKYQIGGTTLIAGQATGYGTPTGGSHQASFAANSITLPNLAAAVAQLIIDLKAGNMPAT